MWHPEHILEKDEDACHPDDQVGSFGYSALVVAPLLALLIGGISKWVPM